MSTAEALRTILDSAGVEYEPVSDAETMVALRGEHKLVTNALLTVAESALVVEAFFMRRPDDNKAEVYAFLLRRNLRTFGVHFAIDRLGDVYLTGRLPLASVSAADVDTLLGSVLAAADECFNPAIALGFSEAIRAEKHWRDKNGLDDANLAPFLRPAD
ncbi:MAG: YbjN domain-containing protein [Mycobacteriales bacterium]